MQKYNNKLHSNEALPTNFHQTVMQIELQIETDPLLTTALIKQLLHLYSQAVIYYADHQKHKHAQMFKLKTQKLLNQEKVQKALKNGEFHYKQQKQRLECRKSEEQLRMNLIYMEQISGQQVRTLFSNFERKQLKNEKLIAAQIRGQKQILISRIKKRKQRCTNKSTEDEEWLQKFQSKLKNDLDVNERVSKKGKKKKRQIKVLNQKPQKNFPSQFIIPF